MIPPCTVEKLFMELFEERFEFMETRLHGERH